MPNLTSLFRRLGLVLPILAASIGASLTPSASMPPAYIPATMPVFSQIVLFFVPTSYRMAFSKTTAGKTFIAELIPTGETVEKWSMMITVSGLNGAAVPLPPLGQRVESTYEVFRKACPATFASQPIGEAQFNGHPAVLVYFSCGKLAKPGYANGHSESVIIAFVRGKKDIYTIQWAERSAAVEQPIPFDEVKWRTPLNLLRAARICDIRPGEPAPYQSCITGR